MKRLQLCALWGFCVYTFWIHPVGADWTHPATPPAVNVNFTLLDSDANHAAIRYAKADKELYSRSNDSIYVGIPIGATYEISYSQWEYNYLNAQGESERSRDTIQSATGDPKELKSFLDSFLQINRMQMQELDILQIQIQSQKNNPIPNHANANTRKGLTLAQMEFAVKWKDSPSQKPNPYPSLTDGYAKLFANLCINGKDAVRLRGKRILPDSERENRFHAVSSGYREKGEIINAASETVSACKDSVRVLVREQGIAAIRAKQIKALSIDPAGIHFDQVRLWHKGIEQTLIIDDNGDGVWGETDAVYFYGEPSDSEFTNDRPYFLTWFPQDQPPKRGESHPLTWQDSGRHFFYTQKIVDDDRILVKKNTNSYSWYTMQWNKTKNPILLDLPGLVPEEQINITFDLFSKDRKNNGFSASIGNCTGYFRVNINSATSIVFSVSASEWVKSPTLLITLVQEPDKSHEQERSTSEKVGDEPFIFVDQIKIDYPRSTQLTDLPAILPGELRSTLSEQPALQLQGVEKPLSIWNIHGPGVISRLTAKAIPKSGAARLPDAAYDRLEIIYDEKTPEPYAVELNYPSMLHRKDQGYNYVIIADRSLMEAARKLAQYRIQQGFAVLLVDVQDIYDEFNYGYPDCDAIKRFLRYAQSEWKGLSPEFVTLIGESTWDHRDREKHGFTDQIPTYAPIDDPQHYGSDEWYAYLWGGEEDPCCDVILGRISVAKAEEVENYIQKLIAYETESPVGPWKVRNLFIADDTFDRHCREAAQFSLKPSIFTHFIDQDAFSHETNPYLYHRFVNYPDPAVRAEYTNKKYCPDCCYAVIDALNEGNLVVQYFGHGGAQLWSHERIFYGTDRPYSNVLELIPNKTYPFVLNWSCLTGYLNLNMPPFNVCLSEEFIRYADRGAIAVWAPSEYGSTDQHMVMSHIIMRSLLQDGLQRLGEAATFTKIEFMLSHYNWDLIRQYIFFGDPGISLPLPKEELSLQVSPPHFINQEKQEFTIRTQAKTVVEGKAILACSIAGKNIYESTPFTFIDGKISHTFAVNLSQIEGATAQFHLYAWNEEKQLDAGGGMAIPKLQPEFTLSSGQVTAEGEQKKITFELCNRSAFPVKPATCLISLGENTQTIPVAALPAWTTQTVEWKGTVPTDVICALVTVQADSRQGIPATAKSNAYAIPVQPPNPHPLIPLIDLVSTNPSVLVESHMTRLSIPFRNISADLTVSATTFLEGPGSATQTREIKLKPQEERKFDYTVTPPQTGASEYRLHVKEQEESVYPFTLPVLGKPDLALGEGDVAISPDPPVIGKTVYLTTTVYNVGESPANDVIVSAFIGDATSKVQLQSFNQSHTVRIEKLSPGESKSVKIIWDPTAYQYLGKHQIFIKVDPDNRIEESNKANNTISKEITLVNLPDLSVDPWSGHGITLYAMQGLPYWGQKMKLTGRVTNNGESDAHYVRLSFLHNRKEYTGIFRDLKRGANSETSVDVPLYSSKNALTIVADKYDLIGEKNESADQSKRISSEKRLYVQMRMPPAPIINQRRTYHVTDETHFSAGVGEFLIFDPQDKSLKLIQNLEQIRYRITPAFVKDADSYSAAFPDYLWQWNEKYNSFYSALKAEAILSLALPAPNGLYDVLLHMYSISYRENKPEKFLFKTPDDANYQLFEHSQPKDGNFFRKIGSYHIKGDQLLLELKSLAQGLSTSFSDILFVRTGEETPVSAGYLSPYFPADDSGNEPAELTWESEIPDKTGLTVKARWVETTEDGSLRFLPWAKTEDGKTGKLSLPGKGKFLQYYVNFIRFSKDDATPSLRNVTVAIPGTENPENK